MSQTAERSRSKARQLTVGVTMPKCLKNHLAEVADAEGTSFADVSRTFVVFGFNNFEDQTFKVSPDTLFYTLKNELSAWRPSKSEQVMLRLEAKHAVRIRLAAKEYSKSASELSALCMAHGVALQKELRSLDARVSSYRGASIKKLLPIVNLESYAAPLLIGVLAGSIRAPNILQQRLADFFETSDIMLSDLFRRSFANRSVPAFKAELGKPVLARQPSEWYEAVTKLGLTGDEEKLLIELDSH